MPKCFVIMGFGKKTDYPTGRVLDLDKSYRYIIKPAALSAGYECVRADEIQHAGNINVPMYQELLNADVVIADVSTYNPNAFYELGVRHALKPFTTITIAEDRLVFPFDIGQLAIRKYRHLGEGIDFDEVERMRNELREAINIVGAKAACDSPVYTFLRDLRPPLFAREEIERALASASTLVEPASQPTIHMLLDQADAAFSKSDYVTAKSLISVVRSMVPTDNYVAQRLALATYKSELPTREAALNEAAAILEALGPATTTDSETLGLYGAIHKHLWHLTEAPACLDTAIWAHEKGFYLKNDYYNGINMAFLLNERAALNAVENPAEAIADFVIAQRIRRRVLVVCQTLLESTPAPKGTDAYWIKATMAEAYAGLGEQVRAQEMLESAKAQPGLANWMIQTGKQLAALETLIAQSPLSRISATPIR
jgi:hypothetical protein